MNMTIDPQMFHLPPWMSEHAVAEWESSRSARSITAGDHNTHFSRHGEFPNTRWVVTGHIFEEAGYGRDVWCWRHLSRCHKIKIGWHLRLEEGRGLYG